MVAVPTNKKQLAQVIPQHTVKVSYVDPDPQVRPWGYRVQAADGRDIALEVARKGHLKTYRLMTRHNSEAGVSERVAFDWVPGRSLDTLIGALIAWGYAERERDVWVVHSAVVP